MASPTFHTTLLQLVNTALQALASVPADRVYVERAAAIVRDECPAINLLPGENRFEAIGSEDGQFDLLKVSASFSLKVHTRGDGHTALADPAIAEANAALMADASLGGYCLRLRLLSSRPQQAEADGTAGIYELGYEATVVVSERDLVMRPL